MYLYFVTTNKHKVIQAKKIFEDYGIEIEHVNRSYDESSDDDNLTIVKKASKMLCDELSGDVMVEDTSFFFDAYPGFPGSLAKFVFEKIGYEGIFRLLEGKKRTGYFSSAIGYCEKGKEPIIIEKKMHGKVIERVNDKDKDVLPYCRIFVPDGFVETMSRIDDKELYSIMHRTKAYIELAKVIKKKDVKENVYRR